MLRATTACTFSIAQLPKSAFGAGVFCTFSLRNVLRATTVLHFFNISSSKNALALMCFVRFYFGMCFAPQRRALFQHLIFQKCSGAGVFCTFLLRSVLRARAACNDSSSHLTRRLRTHCFSEPTFRPSRAPNHWKNTVFRDFSTFSCTVIFFLLTLSLL